MDGTSTLSEPLHVDTVRDSTPLVSQKSKYFYFFIPAEWVYKIDHPVNVNNHALATIFLLLNTMIGAGVFVQAHIFRKSGVVIMLFEYLIIGYLNLTGCIILMHCSERKKIYEYSALTEMILGTNGAITVDVCIALGNYGNLIVYILLLGSLLTDVFKHCSSWYCSVEFLTILPVLTIAVPFCLIRKFGHLSEVAYVSIGVIFAVVLLVVIGGPLEDNSGSGNVNLGDFVGTIQSVGGVIFALGYITGFFPAYNALEDKTMSNYETIFTTASIIGVSICFITGLAGYLSFTSDTETNILENFDGSLGGFFKLAVVGHLLLYLPGDFVIMRDSLLKLSKQEVEDLSDPVYFTWTLVLFGTVTLIALILQISLGQGGGVIGVINITGGVLGSVIYFIIPGLCGIVELGKEAKDYMYEKSVALVVFGFAAVVVVVAGIAI